MGCHDCLVPQMTFPYEINKSRTSATSLSRQQNGEIQMEELLKGHFTSRKVSATEENHRKIASTAWLFPHVLETVLWTGFLAMSGALTKGEVNFFAAKHISEAMTARPVFIWPARRPLTWSLNSQVASSFLSPFLVFTVGGIHTKIFLLSGIQMD